MGVEGGMFKFQIDSCINFNMQIFSSINIIILQVTPAYCIINRN